MKRSNSIIKVAGALVGVAMFATSCVKDLLDQKPSGSLPVESFWKTEADATLALQGAYADIRPCFDRDYYMDGQGEYYRVRGQSSDAAAILQKGDAYRASSTTAGLAPSGYGQHWDNMYKYLYGGVNRTNYVITNVERMLETAAPGSVAGLERVVGEAKLLRALCYFKLISMWGDVPYFTFIPLKNDDVSTLARTPIENVKDSILADLNYAFEKLPPASTEIGRMAKPAALALRGKVQLYWASWNSFGWPELPGFTPDAAKATAAYNAAAADFRSVINDYGLTLFRNGDPGVCDPPGKAENLPNYYYLFTNAANGDKEMLLYFTHGGTGTGQGEELMRDNAGRSHEGSQGWAQPRFEVANRYQRISTGDFAPALIPMNPSTAGARTALNSAVNPQSYVDRDYRMKATIQWDYEVSVGFATLKSTGWVPWIFGTFGAKVNIGGVEYTSYQIDGNTTGYVMRKFVRNTPGLGRSEGDYAWPVIRLADVFLMYAEATNAVNGPQTDAIDLVNRVRRRGNLPALAASKTVDKPTFFEAIEQERIIELFAEGQRGFDIRRWRALERVWGPPGGTGKRYTDTWGANGTDFYRNTTDRTYQQNYIFRIPPGERDRNPNLTQNTPWL